MSDFRLIESGGARGYELATTLHALESYVPATGRVTEFTDDFNRANGTPGSTWNQHGIGTYVISSNQFLRQVGGSSDYVGYVSPLSSVDHWVEADVIGANSLYVVIHGRSTGVGQECYMGFLVPGSSTATIGMNTGFFGFSTVASATFAHGDTHRLRLELQGSAQRLYVDDVLAVTAGDTTLTGNLYVGFNAGGGGLYDNFAAGTFSVGGGGGLTELGSDDFARSDGAIGGTWDSLGNPLPVIATQAAVLPSSETYAQAVQTAVDVSTQYIEVVVSALPLGVGIEAYVRLDNTGNCYTGYIEHTASGTGYWLGLARYDGTTWNDLGFSEVAAPSFPFTLRVEHDSTGPLRLYLDDVLVQSASSTTYSANIDVGFGPYSSSTGITARAEIVAWGEVT